MCDVPSRRWRDSFRPARVLLALAAILCVAAGVPFASVYGLGLIAVGAALALAAVVLPVIREVEFGFPVGVRVKTAVRDREEELDTAFHSDGGDLSFYAVLLLGDTETATGLVEAACARTAAAWRGPVTRDLRIYAICVMIELVSARDRWMEPEPEPEPAPALAALAQLPLQPRVAVVLHEFGGIPLSQIAAITNRPLAAVRADLQAAEQWLARSSSPETPT